MRTIGSVLTCNRHDPFIFNRVGRETKVGQKTFVSRPTRFFYRQSDKGLLISDYKVSAYLAMVSCVFPLSLITTLICEFFSNL